LSDEVLATLEVNQIRRTMRLLAVTPAVADLSDLAAACGATMIERTDRQSGYLRADQLGHVQRWVSSAKTSHLIISAELQHTT